MNGVNLMPKPRLRAAALRRRGRRWIAGTAAYAVLMVAVCLTSWARAGSVQEDMLLELAHATQRLVEAERRVETNTETAEKLERALAATRAVGEHPDWSLMLRLLSEHCGDDMVLESIEISVNASSRGSSSVVSSPQGAAADGESKTPAPGSSGGETYDLRVTGIGLTQQRVMGYAGELQRFGRGEDGTGSSVFTSVDIKRTYSVEFAGRQCVGFVMECRLAPRRLP